MTLSACYIGRMNFVSMRALSALTLALQGVLRVH
jgi:hypothetical protein